MDFGALAESTESGPGIFDSGAVRMSAGFGVSWRSPLGPVAIDLGWPILKEGPDEAEVLRFSFGTRF